MPSMCKWLVAGLVVSSAAAEELPAPLLALESSRAALVTGRIDWSIQCNRAGDQWERPRHFTSRFAGDDYLLEDRGDAEGVLFRDAEGKPDIELGRQPYRWLLHDGKQWEKRDSAVWGIVKLEPTDVMDARCFGLSADVPRGASYSRRLRINMQKASYRVETQGDFVAVIAELGSPGNSLRWLIDPQRGGNVVEFVYTSAGKLVACERSELAKFGDAWFPSRTKVYRQEFEEGREPLYVIEVHQAAFNQPDQPMRFMPEDIGIEVGTTLELYKDTLTQMRHQKQQVGWDGAALIPFEKLVAEVNSGRLKVGDRQQAAVRRSQALGWGLDGFLLQFESYTRHFIGRYELDSEQVQKANSILDDCKRRATEYAAANKDDFERVQGETRTAQQDGSLSAAERQEQLAALARQMQELERPLHRIFYHQLAPRLSKLPTRAQEKAAADREAKRLEH